ncbi:MAG: hypothetical protein R3D63_06630 [Paracoccaceae bacterium]
MQGQPDRGRGPDIAVDLVISQPVPWRVRVLDGPHALVLDIAEVDWAGLDRVARAAPQLLDLPGRNVPAGLVAAGAGTGRPYLVTLSEMQTARRARPSAGAVSRDHRGFCRRRRPAEPADWAMPAPADLPPPPAQGASQVVVVLDQTAGGIDPGAERDGQTESRADADLYARVERGASAGWPLLNWC